MPIVAVAESGASVIGWSASATQHGFVAARPAMGSFGPAQDLGPCTFTVVALAPGGDALAGCDESSAGPVRVSVLDTHPPTIAAINVPPAVVAGQPAALSTTLSDLWSGLGAGQPSWNFGDGTTGTGSPVAHTFATPGTYVVSVTASDSAGNPGRIPPRRRSRSPLPPRRRPTAGRTATAAAPRSPSTRPR